MLATVASISRARASSVAQAMCGVIRQFRALRRADCRVGSARETTSTAGAGQPSRVERLGQVGLDDQRAAGRVDQERTRLDQSQPLAIDQAGRLRRQGTVQADHVRRAKSSSSSHRSTSAPSERRRWANDFVGDDRHAECPGPSRPPAGRSGRSRRSPSSCRPAR